MQAGLEEICPRPQLNPDRFAGIGALQGGKAEGEALQIIGRRVVRFSIIFDSRNQFGHRSVETIGKPLGGQLRNGDAFFRVQRDMWLVDVGADADQRSLRSHDDGAVLGGVDRVATKEQRSLGVRKFNDGLGGKRGYRSLG